MQGKQKKRKDSKKHTRLVMIELIVVGALAIGGWAYVNIRSAGEYVNEQDAIRINGQKYTLSDVNYFFYTYYESFREQNSDLLSYMIDDSKSLKDQEYEEGRSWFDYFLDESLDSMINVAVVAEAAGEENFTLSEDSQTQIQKYLDGVSSAAENSGITADQYMQQVYGQNMTLDRYGELLTMSFTAKEYSQSKQDEIEVTEADIEKQYEENREIYDAVDYERLYFKACDADEEPTAEQMDAAKALAQKAFAELKDGQDLKTVSEEEAYSGSVYYSTDEAFYSTGYSYGDWLFSDERNDGDSEVLEDSKGYYVMVFHKKSRHEYPVVTFYDLSFPIDTSADDTDQEYEDSCSKAEEALAEWESGEKTEEQFAALYKKYSSEEDMEGLHENATKDGLDSYIKKWCFDESRKTGDCEVVYDEDGFHVLYYEGTGEPAWKVEAADDVRETELQDMLDSLNEKAEVKQNEKALQNAASSLNEKN